MTNINNVLSETQQKKLKEMTKFETIKLIWACRKIYNDLCPQCKVHLKDYSKYCKRCKGIASDIMKRTL